MTETQPDLLEAAKEGRDYLKGADVLYRASKGGDAAYLNGIIRALDAAINAEQQRREAVGRLLDSLDKYRRMSRGLPAAVVSHHAHCRELGL